MGEVERVRVLHDLDILDRPRDPALDALARVASHIAGTPMAVLNLIDTDRQWQAAAHGTEPGEVTRDQSMCGYSVLSRDVTYTPDASRDQVFHDNPFVAGELADVRLYVSAPLIVQAQVIGTLCAFAPEPGELTRVQIERLRDLADTAAQLLQLRHTAGELAQAATRDPLTGLPNRTLFEEAALRAFARRDRTPDWPGVLFVDLDCFKAVNDRHGHHAGDVVLREVAARLLASVRPTDLVARLGGDEFVILMEEPADGSHDAADVEAIAERVREAVAGPLVLPDGSTTQLAASVGSARSAGPEEGLTTLVGRADAAMYADKAARSGRRPTPGR